MEVGVSAGNGKAESGLCPWSVLEEGMISVSSKEKVSRLRVGHLTRKLVSNRDNGGYLGQVLSFIYVPSPGSVYISSIGPSDGFLETGYESI